VNGPGSASVDPVWPHKLAGGAVIVKPDIPSARPLERCTCMGMGTARLTSSAMARAAATPIPL
jgi:hypothetical protein